MNDSLRVETDTPVAIDSPDHLTPWGTARDNSKNIRFNHKLLRLFNHLSRPLQVLDLGCSGGGFVRTLLDGGQFAVGIEGSDYSKKTARAEWSSLSDKFLFTADITRNFQVFKGSEKVLFDVITAWEVMEHLPEARLNTVLKNMKNHLASDGIMIVSISPNVETIYGKQLHLTVQKRSWWKTLFQQHGFKNLATLNGYFNTQFIRGPKQNAPGSFHLFLSLENNSSIVAPSISWKEWCLDRWLGSRMQKRAQLIITGSQN